MLNHRRQPDSCSCGSNNLVEKNMTIRSGRKTIPFLVLCYVCTVCKKVIGFTEEGEFLIKSQVKDTTLEKVIEDTNKFFKLK